jgi:hypothetical protein
MSFRRVLLLLLLLLVVVVLLLLSMVARIASEKRTVGILDAHCPHLGANLAVKGRQTRSRALLLSFSFA